MGDINFKHYEGKAALNRLRKLGGFFLTFSQPWFSMVEDVSYRKIGNHIHDELLEYHDLVLDFISTCLKDKWIISGFDWAEWAKQEGSAFFDDHALLMEAGPLELAKVLTVIFGREHANHGYLVEAYGNGLLLTVLKRAHQISAMQPFQEAA